MEEIGSLCTFAERGKVVRRNQDIFGTVAVLVGAVVGAGFASGQEVNQFFASFGRMGLVGVALATILLISGGRLLLTLAYSYQFEDYRQAVRLLLGEVAAKVADVLVGFFLLGGLAVMISGGGEVLTELVGWPGPITSFIFAVLVLVGTSAGAEGLTKINKGLVPLLVGVALLLIGSRMIYTVAPASAGGVATGVNLLPHWAISAVLYAAFNLGIIFTIFSSLGRYLPDRHSAANAATWAGAILGILLLIYAHAILFTPGAQNSPLPLAFLAAQSWKAGYYAYLALLFMAMLTSALANTYALASRLREYRWGRYSLLIILMAAWFIAQGGFVPLVSTIYPAYGYFWLTTLILIMVRRTFAGCHSLG